MKIQIALGTIHKKEKFRVSRGFHKPHRCIVVSIKQDGIIGYGGATEFSVYNADLDLMVKDLLSLRKKLSGYRFETPEMLWHVCHPYLNHNLFALSALDLAGYDFYGKTKQKSVSDLLQLDRAKAPTSSVSISMGSFEEQKNKVLEYNKWKFLKIKIANQNDVKNIISLSNLTDSYFNLDANCGSGWGEAEVLDSLKQLEDSKIEILEQPLPIDSNLLMEKIKSKNCTGIKLFADESFQGQKDIEKCVQGFDGINLKIMKVGGITPTLEIVKEAREKDLLIVAGCMPENTISISATANTAPLFDYIDIDSLVLNRNDFANGLKLENGIIKYTELSGLGFEVLHEELDFY